MGHEAHPNAKFLLITADSEGSNGHKRKAWKVRIQDFSDETELIFSGCHFLQLLVNGIKSNIGYSQRLRKIGGKSFEKFETVVNLIRSTNTETGLKVKCDIDTSQYLIGLKISDERMEQLRIHPYNIHGEWNYTIQEKNQIINIQP